jgi:hypothetical protein
MSAIYIITVYGDGDGDSVRYDVMTPDEEMLYNGCDYETASWYIEPGKIY